MTGGRASAKPNRERINPVHVTFEYKQNITHDFKRTTQSTEEDSSDFDEDTTPLIVDVTLTIQNMLEEGPIDCILQA